MDKKRSRASSPPRSTKAVGPGAGQCVPDIVTRTFDLVTSKEVIPYYVLAALFAFRYSPHCSSTPSPRPVDFVIFNILPLLYLLELVHQPPDFTCPLHDQARKYVRLGLVMSCIGSGMLAWKPDLYVPCWVGSISLAFFFYSIAFFQYYQPSRWAVSTIPPALLLIGSLIYLIKEPLPSTYVAVYGLFLTILGYFAISRLEACRSGPAYLGWAGVMLFALSGYVFALNQLVPSLGQLVSNTVVDMTHYLAQLGIALSTYTIKLCPMEGPSTSGKGSTPGQTDSSASVHLSRSRTKTFE